MGARIVESSSYARHRQSCSHHNEELIIASSGLCEKELCLCERMSYIIASKREHLETAASHYRKASALLFVGNGSASELAFSCGPRKQ